jgi:hypothetical protein
MKWRERREEKKEIKATRERKWKKRSIYNVV